MNKKFILIGSAGYVADRHIKAIKETNNNLIASFDKFDVMGRMDNYFPNSDFFMNINDLDVFINKNKIDYCSICTPNNLHYSHIEFSLKNNIDAICEKPLVLYPEDIYNLENLEKETGKKVYNILQLRYHPAIIDLYNRIKNDSSNKIYDIDLTYITPRGKWYYKSWKGDINKSGSIATNIGVHFFDMLTWIFGDVKKNTVNIYEIDKASGYLQLERARVRWYLSLDYDDIPKDLKQKNKNVYRSITIDGEEIDFSIGFTTLHTETYQNILIGNGFSIKDAKPCILLTDQIRNLKPIGISGDYHPLLKNKQ